MAQGPTVSEEEQEPGPSQVGGLEHAREGGGLALCEEGRTCEGEDFEDRSGECT